MVALRPSEIDGFLARFDPESDPAVDAILVHGPDGGLVAERLGALLARAAPDPGDPFMVSEFDEAELVRAPGRLAEELAALALGSGRRTVVVRAATGAAGEHIAAALGEPRAAILLVAAGDLRPTTALRKAFERAPGAVAIACYRDDERALSRLIDEVLGEFGQTIEADARAALCARLGADRLASRGEIGKLALYAGPGACITLCDIAEISADASGATLDRLVDAMGEGDAAALEAELARALEAGTAPGQLMRAALSHLALLHRLTGEFGGSGGALQGALAKQRPPIHFLRRDSVARQLRRWSEQSLRRALELAGEGERASRGDQALARSAAARALLQITLLGAGQSGQRPARRQAGRGQR